MIRVKRKSPPVVAISMGDPAGVGAEIILKAATAFAHRRGTPALVVVGDLDAMRAAASRMRGVVAPYEWTPGGSPHDKGLPVMSVSHLPESALKPGNPTLEGANASYNYVVSAAKLAMSSDADALVTAPISKLWVNRAGHRIPGHSELLAEISGAKEWRMMFAGDKLRLALVTVHISLAEVPAAITRRKVLETISMLASHLQEFGGIARPRVGVLGLNPHAGENGLFGEEEIRAIAPAIKLAREDGIDAFGPLAPDTAYIRRRGQFAFDAAVAMYHDQGLIALKTLEFDRAVNVTLGLPFIRTSPDHGTAFDIAGRGIANPSSMLAAIDYAWRAAARSTVATRAA